MIFTVVTFAILPKQLSVSILIPAKGKIKTIGIEAYSDPQCTTKITEIDWGLLEPGDIKYTTIYLKNTGTSSIILTKTTDNWNPEGAKDYLILDWDYVGTSIAPNEVKPIKLSLTIAKNISGITTFSFVIVITGSG